MPTKDLNYVNWYHADGKPCTVAPSRITAESTAKGSYTRRIKTPTGETITEVVHVYSKHKAKRMSSTIDKSMQKAKDNKEIFDAALEEFVTNNQTFYTDLVKAVNDHPKNSFLKSIHSDLLEYATLTARQIRAAKKVIRELDPDYKPTSKHIGQPGQRKNMILTFVDRKPLITQVPGQSQFQHAIDEWTFIDSDNNLFVMYVNKHSNQHLERGRLNNTSPDYGNTFIFNVAIKRHIKKHKEPHTVITRPSTIKELVPFMKHEDLSEVLLDLGINIRTISKEDIGLLKLTIGAK